MSAAPFSTIGNPNAASWGQQTSDIYNAAPASAAAAVAAVHRQGNVRLGTVRVTGQPACQAPVIEVGASYTCNTTVVSTQPQFEAAEMVVTFEATATPK
jgi:hypothetical protein